MNIQDFYKNVKEDINIEHISISSLDIKPNTLFICIVGKNHDGHDFILDAIKKGASFIVSNKKLSYAINHVVVKDTKLELVRICQIFYQYKENSPKLIGVTGTDGKTTTSLILYHLLNKNNESSYIGTNGVLAYNLKEKTKNTTLSPHLLYKYFNIFNKMMLKTTILEVSSEGILDKRIHNLKFNGAIFTNLTQEHLNTHKTMKNYFNSKLELFKMLDNKSLAVINADCPYGKKIIKHTKAYTVTYGIKNGLYQAREISLKTNMISYILYYQNSALAKVKIPLFGSYNVYNSLAAITYAYEMGIDLSTILKRFEDMIKIEGRFEYLEHNKNTYIVDYAHTPNAIDNLLTNINLIPHNRVILVIGSAGEKDKKKRPLMGRIANIKADITIFTSEDPKNESIFSILSDLTKDVYFDYYITLSRKKAIKLAVELASENDIIVVVGKGSESYENIKNTLYKHNDLKYIKYLLNI